MKKNVIIVVLSLIIIFGTIIIGTSQLNKDTEEIIANAITATENLKNFEAELVTHNEIIKEEVITTTYKSDFIYFSDPYKIYINMAMLSEANEMETIFERYAVYDGQKFMVYTYDFTYYNKWELTERFRKEQVSLHGRESTIKEDIVFFLKNADKFAKDREEKIKDYDTIKYTGTFTGYSLRNLYRNMGYDDNLIDGVTENYKSFDISIWIDKKSNNVVKYSMDRAPIFNYIFGQQLPQEMIPEKIVYEKYTDEVTIFNFNKASDFEIPQEVLDTVQQEPPQ